MLQLTAIIINYNTKKITNNCINSLKKSMQDIKYNITLVDNGSKDGSVSFLKKTHPDINFIINKKNTGFSYACNQAVESSLTSEFFLFVNSDTIPTKNNINKMLEYIQSDQDIAIVGAQLINKNSSLQHSFANFPTLLVEIFGTKTLNLINKKRYPLKSDVFKKPFNVESVIGAFFIIRAEVFRKINGFDQRYFFFLEETDLCKKISLLNKKIIFMPEIKVEHLQGASANKNPVWSRHNFYRSKYQYLKKWNGFISLTLIYLKNYITFFCKTITYAILNSITFFAINKLTIKFNVSKWLLKNHLLGFPPFYKKPKEISFYNKEKNIDNMPKQQTYDHFSTFMDDKKLSLVNCFSSKTKFMLFYENIMRLNSIEENLHDVYFHKKTYQQNSIYPYSVEFKFNNITKKIDDCVEINEEDIIKEVKRFINDLANKLIFIDRLEKKDLLIEIYDQKIFKIHLLNYCKVKFGCFFSNKTNDKKLNSLFS